MAKIINYYLQENGKLSQLKEFKTDTVVQILRMKGEGNEKDAVAAQNLNCQLSPFIVITKDGEERILGIQGSQSELENLEIKIGKAAYDIVLGEGGGRRRDTDPRDPGHLPSGRWEFP